MKWWEIWKLCNGIKRKDEKLLVIEETPLMMRRIWKRLRQWNDSVKGKYKVSCNEKSINEVEMGKEERTVRGTMKNT